MEIGTYGRTMILGSRTAQFLAIEGESPHCTVGIVEPLCGRGVEIGDASGSVPFRRFAVRWSAFEVSAESE